MYKQLRRQIIPNPATGGAAYVAVTIYWDTVARTYYPTLAPSDVADPAELAVGDEVDRWILPSGAARVVSYAGGGRVTTHNAAAVITPGVPGTCSTDLVAEPVRGLVTADLQGVAVSGTDGYVKLYGNLGTPPYRLQLTNAGGQVLASGTRRTPLLPLEVFGLTVGRYAVQVSDAAGCVYTRPFDVVLGAPTGIPYGPTLLDSYQGNGASGQGTRTIWNPATKNSETYGYTTGADDDGQFYTLATGSVVDAYVLADGETLRTWRVTDPPLVAFADETPTRGASSLTLDNLILFHPDTPGAGGGAVVEVNATAPPLLFELLGTAQQNATGYFDGLGAADYQVRVSDAAGNALLVPFSLRQRYGPRWALAYDDLDGNPLRLELWLRGYSGPVEKIFGQGEAPVVLRTDGLNGTLGGQGDIPVVVGTSAELSLLVLPGTLESVVVSDDRACRCDVYAGGVLQFRGYVTPDVYTEPLLSGYLPIALTATDGLAGLKDTYFLGHIGQRLGGRYPLLNSLLHCLSRCDVALPLLLAVNRRSTEMSDADAPELAATTDRLGYWNKDADPTDCRAVVDALAQLLGGTLIQRQGQWQVRSPLEAALPAPARCYRPAGNGLPAATVAAPGGAIVPPRDPGAAWWWQGAGQQKQLRPGWKSLTGTSDAGWRKNAFPAGEVFSDPYAWLGGYAVLRPLSGWAPGTDAGFPMLLVQAGEKGGTRATQWPRRGAAPDGRYLISPPLPLVPAPESCPAYLNFTARLVPKTYLSNGQGTADAATSAVLLVEVVVDGQRPAQPLVLTVPLAKSATDQETVLTLPLPALPTGTHQTVLYAYAWQAPAINLLLQNTDGSYQLPLYDRRTGYKVGDVVRWIVNGVMGVFQAKSDLLLPVSEPGGLPIGTRDWASNTEFVLGYVVVYQGTYFYARRNLYAPVPVPPAAGSDGNWQAVARADIADASWQPLNALGAQALLLVSSFGVELRPQQATWNGADNFRADGPAGTVRPTTPLAVFHPDVPVAAGLFEGNRYAFAQAVALSDGSLSTAWARAIDLQPAPVFEANVYDALVLRSGPSRLLTGTVRHRGQLPPLLLDAVDAPADVAGRRFCVGATAWNLKQATAEVSLLEIGAGAGAPPPVLALPAGVRLTHQAYEYAPGQFAHRARAVHGGGWRIRH